MRLFPLPERSKEQEQIEHPDNGQPQVGVPLRLGVFLTLCCPQKVSGTGNNDKGVVTKDYEPGHDLARHARAAGPLNHIHGRRQQNVSAERKNHR